MDSLLGRTIIEAMIGILDIGLGNLSSVQSALKLLGAESRRVKDPKKYEDLDALVLPGVGAFPTAAGRLRDTGLHSFIVNWHKSRRPLMGICLGFQLLFEESTEMGQTPGFGFLPGKVDNLAIFTHAKVPHIGWRRAYSESEGVESSDYFYFNHSYFVRDTDSTHVEMRSNHDSIEFVASIRAGSLFGAQFHPEKSAHAGSSYLKAFVDYVKDE